MILASEFFYWGWWGWFTGTMLLVWIPLTFYFFKRKPTARMAALLLLNAAMWLPEVACFDLPIIPPVGKHTISAVTLFLAALWKSKARVRAARLWRGPDLITVLLMLSSFGSTFTNLEPSIQHGDVTTHLPGLAPTDFVAMALEYLFNYGIPFMLGRMFLRSSKDIHDFFHAFVVCAIVYTLPILYELRMSPNLHQNIYSHPTRNDWLQSLRAGGYRPSVFMDHGLVLGQWMLVAMIIALALHKMRVRTIWNFPTTAVVTWLGVMLVFCRATSSLVYALALLIFMFGFSPKAQLRFSLLLGLIVFSYPVARITNVFPTDKILQISNAISTDRGGSLQFRFDNEDVLGLRAMEKPYFGWGGYRRERIFDPVTGRDLTVQDGFWIIVIGQHGIVGFVLVYSLLLLPLIEVARKLRTVPLRSDRIALGTMSMLVAVCAVNTLPNMSLPNFPYFMSGGLWVLIHELPLQARKGRKQELAQLQAAQNAVVADQVAARITGSREIPQASDG